MATTRKRRPTRKQLAALAKGRATRKRNLRKKSTRRKSTRRTTKRRSTTTTKRRTTARPKTRSRTVARRRKASTKRRRAPSRRRRSFGGGFVPAGTGRAVAFGTAGFVGGQLIVDKAPLPPNFKTGNGRLLSKALAGIALGYVARKFAGVAAADARAITVGALMSPALDIAGTMLAKVGGGVSGIAGDDLTGLGQIDDIEQSALPGGELDELDALEALTDGLQISA